MDPTHRDDDLLNYKFSFLLVVVSILGPLYALAVGSIKPVLFPFVMSIICFLLSILNLIFNSEQDKYKVYLRLALVVALGTSMPSFYTGVGPVVRSQNLPLNDEALLRIDNFLLGSFFPDGQIALAIDQNTIIGPTSIMGRLLTEILQLSYVSYYVWGYLLLLRFLGLYLWSHWKSDQRNRKDWRLVKMFICAWLGTCILNFTINLLVPAVSPRLYIADRFENILDGFGLAGIFRRAVYVAGEGSYGTFPSAHTSISWVTGLVAIRFFPKFGRSTLTAAFLITIATVFLRYHYVIDIIGAVPLVVFGMLYGGYVPLSEVEAFVVAIWSFPAPIISRFAMLFPLSFSNLDAPYPSSYYLKQKSLTV